MQASSFTTNFKMSSNVYTKQTHRLIGTSKTSESVDSHQGYWDSVKRKKFDTTDWTCRTVDEQEGNLSHTCVFTRARKSTHIPEFGSGDTISPKRASNHRYGPGYSLASGTVGRHLVPRRIASNRSARSAGSITSG